MILSYFIIAILVSACIVGAIAGNEYMKTNFGEDYARHNLFFFVFILLSILLIFSLIIFLGGRDFYAVYLSLVFLLFLVPLFAFKIFDKTPKGKVLRILEIDESSKSLYYIGILQFFVQPFYIYSGITYFSNKNQLDFLNFFNKFGIPMTCILFGFYAVIFFRFPIKLYENGINVQGSFVEWHRIQNYKFLSNTQYTFQFQYQHRIPLFPKSTGFVISKKDQDSLQEILQQKLPHLGEVRA